MNVRKHGMMAGAVLAAGLVSFSIGAVATANNEPPAPAWVRPDGTLDRSKLPECIVAIGSDGQPLRDDKGKSVCVPTAELFAPPAAPAGEKEAKSAKELRRYKDKDGRDVIVIESEGWESK